VALKKAEFNDDAVPIFEDALVYKLGQGWFWKLGVGLNVNFSGPTL
jgi:hypothetical protein